VGDYSVTYSEIENFIKDQGFFVGELFGSLSVAGKGDVVMSSASLALDIFGRVSKIASASTFDGTKYLQLRTGRTGNCVPKVRHHSS
jgi:hypothetical protein